MKRQRTFLALPLSAEIVQGIQHFRTQQAELQHSRVRWIPPKNLHITLFFLGDVLLEETANLCRDLHSTLSPAPALKLRFERFSAQPRRKPRMIWARFSMDERFSTLARTAAEVCHPYLLENRQSHKEPIPHVTIARLKGFSREPALKTDHLTLPPLHVERAELWSSQRDQRGSLYTSMASFDFHSSGKPMP